MSGPAVLAVDGGNSKTEVALVDGAGNLLGAARGPGTSHHHLGLPAAMVAVAGLSAAACRAGGVRADGRPLAEVGVWCLAGLDFPADDQAVGPAVAGRRWAGKALLHNDVFAVLWAGSQRPWGVGVVCGAGMNCVGVAPDGREVRFPAVGELSGDWGGGHDVGVAAVGAALRGEDGRGPETTLTGAVAGWFGLGSALAVVEALFCGRIDRRRVLELVPLVSPRPRPVTRWPTGSWPGRWPRWWPWPGRPSAGSGWPAWTPTWSAAAACSAATPPPSSSGSGRSWPPWPRRPGSPGSPPPRWSGRPCSGWTGSAPPLERPGASVPPSPMSV